jgi:hypothetical protein
MMTASFFVVGALCLMGLYKLGDARQRRVLLKVIAVAVVLVVIILAWLVLQPGA